MSLVEKNEHKERQRIAPTLIVKGSKINYE